MEGPESGQACPRCLRLERRIAELEAQLQRLSAALEEARRAGKRQAAPFRKGPAKAEPKKPGRKPGEDYGPQAHRLAPPPKAIDETYEVSLPRRCPHCSSGHLQETHTRQQFQVEIPRRPIYRRFDVHIGHCRDCGRRVQGRHPLQSSDALGAAAVQLGPETHAALAVCNKGLGLSHGKCARLMEGLFGLPLARSTVARSLRRLARRCRAAYEQIRAAVRGSPWVSCDETGWRVAGQNAWLHTFVGSTASCYVIDSTRSHRPAEALLGRYYSGVLIHDGWSPYDQFYEARHQQCLAHLLRRCRELLETATRGAVRFPRALKRLLQQALGLRDRFAEGQVTPHGLAVARGRLAAQLWRLIEPIKNHPAHERFAEHLGRHFGQLLTFLQWPGLDATNWRAEQALRPAVVNRKVWGGNRTDAGARDQSILMSLLTTCRQHALDPLDYLAHTLRATNPLPLPLPMR